MDENHWFIYMVETRVHIRTREPKEDEQNNEINHPNALPYFHVTHGLSHISHHSHHSKPIQSSPHISFGQTLERFHFLESTP